MPPRPETMTTMDDADTRSFTDPDDDTRHPNEKNRNSMTPPPNSNNSSSSRNNKGTMKLKSKVNNNGLTVSQFHHGQQSMQDAAVARSKSEMARIQRQHQHQHQHQQQHNQRRRNSSNSNNTDDDNSYNNTSAAATDIVVPAKSTSLSSATTTATPAIVLEKVVDVVPSDHPSAATILFDAQTHRTCHLCHRSLPRSQFAERDNTQLSPYYYYSSSYPTTATTSMNTTTTNTHGRMTCRTCTMTLCAANLSTSPTSMQLLLLQYAHRAHEMGNQVLLAAVSAAAAEAEAAAAQAASTFRKVGDGNTNLEHPSEEEEDIFRRMLQGNDNMNNSEMGLILRQRSSIHSTSHDSYSATYYQQHGPLQLSTRRSWDESILSSSRPATVADCKYIDALLTMPCYLNINALGIFGSSAEVSGSMAALEAVRLYGTVGGGSGNGGGRMLDEESGEEDDGGYHRYFVPHDCDGRPVLLEERNGKKKTTTYPVASTKEDDGVTTTTCDNDEIINPRSIVCLVLGEGKTPRTAILASQHYCWTTIAIDPSLSEEWMGCHHDDVPNFVGYRGSLSDFMNDEELVESMISSTATRDGPPPAPRHLVIIGIQPLHSSPSVRLRDHGHINELRDRYGDVPTTVVSLRPIPETNWFSPSARMEDGTVGSRRSKLEGDLGYEPNFSYIDEGIFSQCRQVEVWNFHNADDDDDDFEEDEDYDEEEEYDERANEEEEDANKEEVTREEKGVGSVDKVEMEEGPFRNASKTKGGEEHIHHRGGPDQRRHHDQPAKQASKKKNLWLEARVAEFKMQQNQRKERNYNEEHNASFNTLSTKGTVDQRRVSDVFENPDDIANQCYSSDHQEVDNSSVLSPQDEVALNRVWDKAMSVYDEQQSLCDSSHQQRQHHDDNVSRAEKNPHDDLPAGWEAFVDPASGDQYYANSETGESSWDKPSFSTSVENCHDDDDDDDDRHPDDSTAMSNLSELTPDDQPGAAAASSTATNSKAGAGVPSFMQYKPKHHPRLSTIQDNDSQSHFDDQSSVSSGIAALNRWNMMQDNNSLPERADSGESPGTTQERRGSASQKQQPWHKKESDEMGNGDSFMFDDYY